MSCHLQTGIVLFLLCYSYPFRFSSCAALLRLVLWTPCWKGVGIVWIPVSFMTSGEFFKLFSIWDDVHCGFITNISPFDTGENGGSERWRDLSRALPLSWIFWLLWSLGPDRSQSALPFSLYLSLTPFLHHRQVILWEKKQGLPGPEWFMVQLGADYLQETRGTDSHKEEEKFS